MVNSSIPLYFLCFFYFSVQKCNIFWNTVLYDWVKKFLGTLCLSQTFDSFRCLSIPFWYFFGTCLSFWVAIRVILDTEASKWHHALRFNLFLWKICIRAGKKVPDHLKFMFSEKATKVEEIFTSSIWHYVVSVK